MIATICAYDVIRHIETPKGRKRYQDALKAGARKFGALCCVAADALPYLETEAIYEVAAEAQAIRNMQ